MRRKDREVSAFSDKLAILEQCAVVRIAMTAEPGQAPYLVPLNFGYEADPETETLTLYFHGASAGRKMELLRKNPDVGFEADTNHVLVEGPEACNYTFRFASVIGTGTVTFPETYEEKLHALKVLMDHYTENRELPFSEAVVNRTCILKLTVEQWTGKQT